MLFTQPSLTNTITKESKLKDLKEWHDSQVELFMSKYSKREQESFPYQREEAKRWELDNTALTPDVDRLALGMGITREELLQAILTNIAQLTDLQGYVGKKRDEIKACTTQAELEAITW